MRNVALNFKGIIEKFLKDKSEQEEISERLNSILKNHPRLKSLSVETELKKRPAWLFQ